MADGYYGLDLHCQMLIDEYREKKPSFGKLQSVVTELIRTKIENAGIFVTAVSSRIKEERSLAGKLELKSYKYSTLSDMTDILGVRVVTFYSEDVDKISAITEKTFDIDWENTVDKRKMHSVDSFGYMSLHYICRLPKSVYFDPEWPELNDLRWELQLRTTLQHMWATMYHDIGYKTGVDIPTEYIRTLNRLAGLLELADDEFSRVRTAINDYRRKVQGLVSSGNFSEVPLNTDTFRSYLQLKPFDKLNRRIAAINQAEIHDVSLMPFLLVFKWMGFESLMDIDEMIRKLSEDAYHLAVHELGQTDLDIISSTVAPQDLCIVFLLKNGAGVSGLQSFFERLGGPSPYNSVRAERLYEMASHLPFMKK